MSDKKYQAATVEDCDSDSGDSRPDTAQSTSPPINTANVAAKRTSQNLKSSTKPTATLDASSDSGYSSKTAATIGSTDSAPPARSKRPQLETADLKKPAAARSPPQPQTRDVNPYTSPTRKKALPPQERPRTARAATLQSTLPAAKPAGTEHSKAVQALRSSRERSTSQPRPPRQMQPQGCPDPYCPQCVALRTPLETQWDINYSPFTQPPSAPQSATTYGPPTSYPYPSPQAPRHAIPTYPTAHPQTIPQLSEPIPRRRSGSRQARPASYHPGATPDGYWVQLPQHYEVPYEYPQTPMSASTYTNPNMSIPSYYHPPTAPPVSSAPNPWRAVDKPPLVQRNTDYPAHHLPQHMYAVQMQTQYEVPAYPPSTSRRPSKTRRPSTPSYSNEQPIYENDRTRMPPPPRPTTASTSRQVVPLRRRSTTRGARSISPDGQERRKFESVYDVDALQRRGNRPPLVAHQTVANTRLEKTISQDSSSSRGRRHSYINHEDSKGIKNLQEAEKHIAKTSGSTVRPTALIQEALDKVVAGKRNSGEPSSPRKPTSNRSRTSSSREGSRAAKERSSHGSPDEPFKIRLDGRDSFRVDFGDMDGKSISMISNEDGMRELVIGSSNPNRKQITYNQDGSVDSRESKSTSRTGRSSGTKESSEKPVSVRRERSGQRRRSD